MNIRPILGITLITFLWGQFNTEIRWCALDHHDARAGDQTLAPSANLTYGESQTLDIPDLIFALGNQDENSRKNSALILEHHYEQVKTFLIELSNESYRGNDASRDLYYRIGLQLAKTMLGDKDLVVRKTALYLFVESDIITWKPKMDPLGECIEEFIFGTEPSQFQFASAGRIKKSYTRWAKEAPALLKEKMPTLMEILSEEERVVRFLNLLSVIRILGIRSSGLYSTDELRYDDYSQPPWEPEDAVQTFRIRELRISPETASFRRILVYVMDQERVFAIEIKMPGQALDRDLIRPVHFTIAQELWERYPSDPAVVKPLFFLGFKGKVPLYDREIEFQKYSLGVVGFLYQEGLRLRNAMLNPEDTYDRLTRRNNLTRSQIYQRLHRDVMVAGIRLHLLGYSGITDRGNDMHTENLRLLPNARLILVGDFGAFERVRIPMEIRRHETYSLTGVRNDKDIDGYINRHIDLFKEILPEVVLMSIPRNSSRVQRTRIAIEAIREIGLEDHYLTLIARLEAIQKGHQGSFDPSTETENKILKIVLEEENKIEPLFPIESLINIPLKKVPTTTPLNIEGILLKASEEAAASAPKPTSDWRGRTNQAL